MFKYNKQLIILLCSTIAFMPCWAVADDSKGESNNSPSIPLKVAPGVRGTAEAIPDQYIVVFKKTAIGANTLYNSGQVSADVAALADTLAHQYGATVDKTWSVVVKGMAVHMTLQQAEMMAKDPDVERVEQDGVVRANVVQNNATWGLDRIDQRFLPLNNVYAYVGSAAGLGVTAFVIDTGIRTTHTQFELRAKWGTNTTGDAINTDCNGHGTHVAGTIGGVTYGVAKSVNLVAVKVLDCAGSGSDSGVISGIEWVTLHKKPKSVANMSLGGGFSQTLNDAVTASIAAGITYGVAAGNDYGVDACTLSPASTPNAITVGATQSDDNRASYSNIGTCLDIFAPGTNITSAWNTSNTAINTINGTSMATPHVVGVAALYLSSKPSTTTPAEVATAITGNSTLNTVISPGTGSPNKFLYSRLTGGDVIAPTVSLTSPTPAQDMTGSFKLKVLAADNVGVTKVKYFVDDEFVGGSVTAPFNFVFNTWSLLNGNHTFTATAQDAYANSAISTPVTAYIANTGACSAGAQLIANSGFESGNVDWTFDVNVLTNNASVAHSGSYFAWLNGWGFVNTDFVKQQFTIPANACSAKLKFWIRIYTLETTTVTINDFLKVNVLDSSDVKLATLAKYSNLNATSGYVEKTLDLIAYKGKTIKLEFFGTENATKGTSFFIDDVTLIERHTPL